MGRTTGNPTIRILLLGAPGVGKNCLESRFTTCSYPPPYDPSMTLASRRFFTLSTEPSRQEEQEQLPTPNLSPISSSTTDSGTMLSSTTLAGTSSQPSSVSPTPPPASPVECNKPNDAAAPTKQHRLGADTYLVEVINYPALQFPKVRSHVYNKGEYDAVLLVYDVTRPATLDAVEALHAEIPLRARNRRGGLASSSAGAGRLDDGRTSRLGNRGDDDDLEKGVGGGAAANASLPGPRESSLGFAERAAGKNQHQHQHQHQQHRASLRDLLAGGGGGSFVGGDGETVVALVGNKCDGGDAGPTPAPPGPRLSYAEVRGWGGGGGDVSSDSEAEHLFGRLAARGRRPGAGSLSDGEEFIHPLLRRQERDRREREESERRRTQAGTARHSTGNYCYSDEDDGGGPPLSPASVDSRGSSGAAYGYANHLPQQRGRRQGSARGGGPPRGLHASSSRDALSEGDGERTLPKRHSVGAIRTSSSSPRDAVNNLSNGPASPTLSSGSSNHKALPGLPKRAARVREANNINIEEWLATGKAAVAGSHPLDTTGTASTRVKTSFSEGTTARGGGGESDDFVIHSPTGKTAKCKAASATTNGPPPSRRRVSRREGEAMAARLQLAVPFFETSARTGEGVEELFDAVVRDVLREMGRDVLPPPARIPPARVVVDPSVGTSAYATASPAVVYAGNPTPRHAAAAIGVALSADVPLSPPPRVALPTGGARSAPGPLSPLSPLSPTSSVASSSGFTGGSSTSAYHQHRRQQHQLQFQQHFHHPHHTHPSVPALGIGLVKISKRLSTGDLREPVHSAGVGLGVVGLGARRGDAAAAGRSSTSVFGGGATAATPSSPKTGPALLRKQPSRSEALRLQQKQQHGGGATGGSRTRGGPDMLALDGGRPGKARSVIETGTRREHSFDVGGGGVMRAVDDSAVVDMEADADADAAMAAQRHRRESMIIRMKRVFSTKKGRQPTAEIAA